MESTKKKVEAVLYTTGKYMTVSEIAEACSIGSVDIVKDSIAELKKEYSSKDGALEIQEYEGMYKLNIKGEYNFIAKNLSGEGEFDGPTLKTLAVIAYKSPVFQSEIIHIRGNKAYEHISKLKEEGLVSSEKSGRTRLLKLTPKFFEYFDVGEREVKEKFEDIEGDVRKNVAWKMGKTPEQVEELKESLDENRKNNSAKQKAISGALGDKNDC
tara:strand:- start:2811 stop:3449 length:639 start_codon:yes stop_codon:yes gene_type:complete